MFAGAALAFGLAVDAAVAVGCALALSSTVFVVQILIERRRLATRMGRAAFTVLLCQDLAIAPILVVTLALVDRETGLGAALGIAALKAVAAVLFIVVLGRYVVRPLFRLAAVGQSAETFAAATLLAVLCTAALTELAGLSLALGGLLAGMLLAETEYRHQVAAEIQPFRGILVGLFFMTVGMSADLGHAWSEAAAVAAAVVGLLALKAAVLGALALLFGLPAATAWPVGLLLAQGGEFSFVVLGTRRRGRAARRRIRPHPGRRGGAVDAAHPAPRRAGHGLGAARGGAGGGRRRPLGPACPGSQRPRRRRRLRAGRAGRRRRGSPRAASRISRSTATPMPSPARGARARRSSSATPPGRRCWRRCMSGARGRWWSRCPTRRRRRGWSASSARSIPEGRCWPAPRPTDHARELAETGADEIVPELVATGDRLAALVPDSADSPDSLDSKDPKP